jgi:hypothetical protein
MKNGITGFIGATLGAVSLALALPATAATDTFITPTGASTGDGAVDASAMFVTGPGTITVTLNDLLANPKSVGQLISDLDFTLPARCSSSARRPEATSPERPGAQRQSPSPPRARCSAWASWASV